MLMETDSASGSPIKLSAVTQALRDLFGDRAEAVAARQMDAAEGETRLTWQRILISLSGAQGQFETP